MRYSLIGCGRVSPEHLRAAKHNGLELAGLCDTDPAQIDRNLGFAKEYLAGVPVYQNYKQLLAAERPQLVAIATPSGLHAQMALDCIAAGAHVIIEKPLAMSMEDAQKIKDAAEKTGLVVCNNLQNRFNPAVKALREAVEAGRFGRIYSASMRLRWFRGEDYYRQAAWRGTRALDGGAMMNQGVHGIDLLCWMLGEPLRVTAITTRLARAIEMEDMGMALVEFRGGALASIECTTLRHPDAEESVLEINGERGCARLGGIAGHMVETWRFDGAPLDEENAMRRQYAREPASVYGSGHGMLYADVIAAIETGRKPLVGIDEGAMALSIVLGAYESSATDKTVWLQGDTP